MGAQATSFSPPRGAPKGRWLAPCAVALCAGGLMAWAASWVRGPVAQTQVATDEGRAPGLVITRVDKLAAGGELREQFRLLDPTPLYMPSDRRADSVNGIEDMSDRPGGEVAKSFEPAFAFPEERPTRDILRANPPQTALAVSEAVAETRWFRGMARRDSPAPQATPVGAGRLEVFRTGETERVAFRELPPDAVLGGVDWRPVELMVLVRAEGVVASPVLVAGSGVVEVDERVRALAAREWLPSLLLRPGSYRLVVGP